MLPWKQKANDMFPELDSRIEEADTPYLLWFELLELFERAYDQSPRDESLINRIYQYSDWCLQQPQGQTAEDDLLTCVAVSFYSHIPTSPAALADMPRWFALEDVMQMKDTFSYLVGDVGFQMILDAYPPEL